MKFNMKKIKKKNPTKSLEVIGYISLKFYLLRFLTIFIHTPNHNNIYPELGAMTNFKREPNVAESYGKKLENKKERLL